MRARTWKGFTTELQSNDLSGRKQTKNGNKWVEEQLCVQCQWLTPRELFHGNTESSGLEPLAIPRVLIAKCSQVRLCQRKPAQSLQKVNSLKLQLEDLCLSKDKGLMGLIRVNGRRPVYCCLCDLLDMTKCEWMCQETQQLNCCQTDTPLPLGRRLALALMVRVVKA